jgi:hypothetical protein
MFPLFYDQEGLFLDACVLDTSTFPDGREGAWHFFELDTVVNDSARFMLYAWTAVYGSGVPTGVRRIGYAAFQGVDTGAFIIDTCWYPPQGHLSYSNGPTGSDYWPRWMPASISVVSELCGDANGDGEVTSGDGFYILNYFGSGPIPATCWAANVNGDGVLTTGDGFHLLNYLGAGSPPNCAPCVLSVGDREPSTRTE